MLVDEVKPVVLFRSALVLLFINIFSICCLPRCMLVRKTRGGAARARALHGRLAVRKMDERASRLNFL